MAKVTIPPPTEEEEQATLLSWAAMMSHKWPELELLFHIPNGGKRSKTEAARFRHVGVKSGVPDLFLPVPRCGKHGLWIEMKRTKGGVVSGRQSFWHKALTGQGYAVSVAYGFNMAKDIIEKYMEGKI